MVTREEIEAKAKEFEINTSDVQRDYLFGWILKGMFTITDIKDKIFLKGGNALRKGYFENTRFSNDLDFGIPDEIEDSVLLQELDKVCDFIQENTGIVFEKEKNRVKEKFLEGEEPLPDLKVYEARIYFKDFFGVSSKMVLKISMDITRFDKVLLDLQEVPLIHAYSDTEEVACTIRCMKLEEIIATKLKCLMQRQHAPDLFDYVYSIQLLGGNLNKNEVIEALLDKTIFRRNPHVLKEILLKTSFDYFREYWAKGIVCAKGVLFSVEDAIKFFVDDLAQAFSFLPDSGYRDFAFFGPDLRVPIMNAGRTQTLLRVIYNGEERMYEPYSLKYLEKKDGTAREYFYAYKLSGGSSAPSIQSLVAVNFQSIENTDTEFTPRDGYAIELCKAGEAPEQPYLFDPNRPLKRPSLGTLRSYKIGRRSGPTYTYQCNYCGKKFVRKKRNSVLKKHKDKNGWDCSGRSASYEGMNY